MLRQPEGVVRRWLELPIWLVGVAVLQPAVVGILTGSNDGSYPPHAHSLQFMLAELQNRKSRHGIAFADLDLPIGANLD